MKKKFLAVITAFSAIFLTACGEEEKSFSKESSINENKTSQSEISAPASSEKSEEKSEESSEESSVSSSDTYSEEQSSSAENTKPRLVEERFYKWEENDSMVITVDIFDNGGWSLSWSMGAEYYAEYSFSDESAGNYAEITGYRLTPSGDADVVDGGSARFEMSENEMRFQYKNSEEIRNFIRIYR